MELRTNSTENINDGNMSEDDAEAHWSEFPNFIQKLLDFCDEIGKNEPDYQVNFLPLCVHWVFPLHYLRKKNTESSVTILPNGVLILN